MKRRVCPLPTSAALLAAASLSFAVAPANAQTASRIGTDDGTELAIAEASLRFGLPSDWLQAVIQAESGGYARAVSRAGAMGLMQVMPRTYAELQSRYGLGSDPFQVRDNVMAGAAYLRELHDRYGPVGMLAAYNAGPGRWEDHLKFGLALPDETLRYLAKLAPRLGVVEPDLPVAAPRNAASRPITDPLFAIRYDTHRSPGAPSTVAPSDARPAQVAQAQYKATLFVAAGRDARIRQADDATNARTTAISAHDADASAASLGVLQTPPTLPTGPLFVARAASR